MTAALVLGASGQDGSYLAESLLRRGVTVTGIGHGPASRHVKPGPGFDYLQFDLRQPDGLADVLRRTSPDIVFHFAAVHGAVDAGFTYEQAWRDMMQVNVLALHVLLEHARRRAPDMKIVYAGSSKVFPAPLSGDVDETTPMRATCLYGIGKIAARDLMLQYRRTHGLKTTNLVLFNHDSPRRPSGFFLPTMAQTIRNAERDPTYVARVRTLDFRIDWSAADEIMDIVVDMALGDPPDEVVVASGRTVYARDAVSELFSRLGLNAEQHLVEDIPRSDPGPDFSVRIDRLVEASGRRPRKTVFDIVGDMLDMSALLPGRLG